ncbi:MAG TPA: helix-turn-helix transcriptional regulator [Pinirhizobacter sp.]|uniref:helix-turn-helix transcriptional regulator n=1 Tax=Pinirhizobacter sp. TaxID=2950432 RepID=UPI002BE6FDEB|nr:helix-turn-helix transcriptional regulator [Pinirhizobacter sp.]HMH67923.1 helix-turn-helix transcriptional regulator [Pinirhizobacter sp.]
MFITTDNSLGIYLKDRRTKLDPAAFGLVGTRRRTPGLRREEVAQRANVSTTWYTWLEQGRGGAPSADVVDRIAHALMLTDVEREHVFLLALGRPPKVRYQAPEGVTPRLQRILDALVLSPAIVKTRTWDIVAWNRAATVVLADYAALPVEQRNVLRLLFGNPHIRERQLHWESLARFVVAAFRADAARAGASKEAEALIDELSRNSPEFAKMWSDHDVCHYGEGIKHLRHPDVGMIAMEFSSFVVDGRSDLSMVVHNPVTPEDADKVRRLIEQQALALP